MIKAYYKSNTAYGADELNHIVKNLRTDGRLGDIANCLEVSKNTTTELKVDIANGTGFVDGCEIEASDSHYLMLPSASGTYYIYMDVTTQSGHVVSADIVQSATEPDNADCILATATVSGGIITTVTNTAIYSQFKGTTQISSIYPEWIAGDYLISSDTVENTKYTQNTYTEMAKYVAGNTGTIKLSITYAPHYETSTAYNYLPLDTSKTAYIRVKVNGVAQGSEMTAVGAVETDTITISVTAGSAISIEGRTTRGANGYVRITNVSFGISRISDTVTKII